MAHFGADDGTLALLGRAKALRITFGVVTVAIGVAVLVWPGITLLAAAVLFGVQLLVTGVFWLVSSFTAHTRGGGYRVLMGVAGLLALLGGILALRAPFQTVAVLALILGATWVIGGVAEVFHGFGASGWAVFSGVVTLVAGIVVLVAPLSSAVALAWLLGIALVVLGVVSVAGAVTEGRSARAAAPRGGTATTGTTATA
ncbi:HdeD family acid-resistance protein [Saccharothrix mutabilis subsp. mutabilis]|uniref:HdeD family acid-resistance protein n=1 Tax=Saccharothrix mutabilis subsp. mutabilis TaxID=66855 RepID=A0ABN0UXW4_9PSEU